MPRLIIGHTTDTSIKIWIRASERWPIAFVDVLDTARRRTAPTETLATKSSEFHTQVITWEGLSPDREYKVKVAFGKSKKDSEEERIRTAYAEGRVRTFPSEGSSESFTFLFGSCNLHSLGIIKKPDRAWTKISTVAKQNEARFMIHCGDQIYADIPLYPTNSLEHYRDKYLDAWDDCRPARRVLTELPHYMILDDHEVVNNFDNDMDDTWADPAALLRTAMKVYWEFQHSHNPQTPSQAYRYYYDYQYGSTRFFVLDTRYERRSDDGEMISKTQLRAFLEWLSTHRQALKFVVTSVPFVGEARNPKKDKWCAEVFSQQRRDILQHIVTKDIEKVVFLTGDMHVSYHAEMELSHEDGRGTVVHELMSSPINQRTPDRQIEDKFIATPPPSSWDGITAKSKIHRGSFFSKHSNIMAVQVEGDDVEYRLYRTSNRRARPYKLGSFTP